MILAQNLYSLESVNISFCLVMLLEHNFLSVPSRLCVRDADAHTDAQSDADERSHVPKFPRSDNNDKVPRSVCQATKFS